MAATSTYMVRAGDTLSRIAAAHATTWQAVAKLNDLTRTSTIHPGQTLRLA